MFSRRFTTPTLVWHILIRLHWLDLDSCLVVPGSFILLFILHIMFHFMCSFIHAFGHITMQINFKSNLQVTLCSYRPIAFIYERPQPSTDTNTTTIIHAFPIYYIPILLLIQKSTTLNTIKSDTCVLIAQCCIHTYIYYHCILLINRIGNKLS